MAEETVYYFEPAGLKFCSDPFYNSSQTWETESPDLSSCFRKTVLVWGPCSVFWMLVPFQLHSLFQKPSQHRRSSISNLSIFKTLLACLLILVSILDLAFWALDSAMMPVDIVDPVIRLVTFGAVLALIQAERVRGFRISPVQFIFFFSYLLFGVVNIYSLAKNFVAPESGEKLLPFVTTIVTVASVLASLLLHFFAEPAPEYRGAAAAAADANAAVDTATAAMDAPNVCPNTLASFPSLLTFSWFTSLAWKGFKRPLTSQDLWLLPRELTSAYVVPHFQRYWEPKVKKVARINAALDQQQLSPSGEQSGNGANVSFIKEGDNVQVKTKPTTETAAASPKRKMAHILPILVKAFGAQFFFGSLLKLAHDLLVFISPMLFKQIIEFVGDSSQPLWRGVVYSLLMLATTSFQTICLGRYFYEMYGLTISVKAALISAIYRKSLQVSVSGKKDTTTGEIVNLMSVDVNRIADLILYINMIWSAPLQIFLSIFFLWRILGPSVLAGLAVIILLVPINGLIASQLKKLQIAQMKEKDKRVKMMNEILQGIKILKLYAWEPSFGKLVSAIRQAETDIMRRMGYYAAGTTFAWSSAAYLVSLVTFATYVLADPVNNVLDPQRAFVSISLFNILRFPMSMLPMIISMMVQANVSLKRIDEYMNSAELKANAVTKLDTKRRKSDGALQNGGLTNNSHGAAAADGSNDDDVAVEIKGCSFRWSHEDEKACLQDVTLKVKKGSLVAIVGQVGSGKSSLLSAILGEMDTVVPPDSNLSSSSPVVIDGSVAYVAQQAWIQNATLKANVLFNRGLEEERYQRVLEACSLIADLEMLQAGDDTEIGEKGINLSGGQKQRVSLARAAYSDSDIYLLDDPLSAVDSHVGKHLFEHIIGPEGILKEKTRILVTHGLTHLRHMDEIIVVADGRISERGAYADLIHKKGAFADFLLQYMVERQESVEKDASGAIDVIDEDQDTLKDLGSVLAASDPDFGSKIRERRISRGSSKSKSSLQQDNKGESGVVASTTPNNKSVSRESSPKKRAVSTEPKETAENAGQNESKTADKLKQQQYEAEKAETGKVSMSVYFFYFKAMGWAFAGSCFGFFTLHQILNTVSSVVLAAWSDSNVPKPEAAADALANTNATVTATPINAYTGRYLGLYGGLGLGQAVAVIVAAIFLYLSTIRGAVKMHDTMLSNVLRSPMSFFDTTPQGRILNRFGKDVDVLDAQVPMVLRGWITCLLGVVATFGVISYTTPVFLAPITVILIAYYIVQKVYIASSRQLKRLESISRSPIYSQFGETVSGVTTIRAYGMQQQFVRQSEAKVDENQRAGFPSVVSNRWLAVRLETVGNLITFSAALLAVLSRDSLSPGLIGLSVSYALSVTQALTWLVRMACDVETNIVAVERLKEYAESKTEAEWDIHDTKPQDSWPNQGVIKFENYSARYRDGLELVLKEVSFDVDGGQKLGIVGRTGAGKSSLTLSLFRIVEAASGRILIDGRDISQLGLHQLRSKLTIIPQEPVLFSGSLRMNLDPLDQYDDADILEALRLAHLDGFVASLKEGLSHGVSEGGENLSVGQRQLICLARALLRKTRVLVLDEATAAVDLETDDLIQATIRKEFSDATVITIAHRLNTIVDADKILVLDKGQVAEFDSPQTLMADKNSIFHAMCKDAGLV